MHLSHLLKNQLSKCFQVVDYVRYLPQQLSINWQNAIKFYSMERDHYQIKNVTVVENKYKEGEVVRAKVDLTLKLVIRRYVDRIYFCKIQEDPNRK